MSGNRIAKSIPSLFNGVSQQAPTLRLPSQCEVQENAVSSIVNGLTKRPPSNHVAKLSSTASEDAFVHFINRDESEQYVLIIDDGVIKVYDLFTGTEKTVATPDGTGYLTATDSKAFHCITVADHTFILNKEEETAMDTTVSQETKPYEAVVFIKQGVINTRYVVKVNGTEYSYTAPTPATGETLQPSTETIASNLASSLGSSGCTVTREGALIKLTKTSDFTFEVWDSYGNKAIMGAKEEVQKKEDLPPICFDGIRLRIVGEAEEQYDDYYVEFSTASSYKTGSWVETRGWGINNEIDASTMPHKLVRESDGTFTFSQITWDERLVGDDESAPEPSFIGTKLEDIFFYRNRLGFLSGEQIVMSTAGEYYNFFPATVTDVRDSDPIDVSVSHTKVSLLKHAIPFNESLILFSDQTQFQLGGSDLLTPNSIRVDVTTEFETSNTCKPVGAGQYVYFATQKGNYATIREYYVEKDSVTNDAADITAHVPNYLPDNITHIKSLQAEDSLFFFSEDTPNVLYVYKYYWVGDEKMQSAWGRWVFDEDDSIMGFAGIGNKLHIVIERSDGIFLENINIQTEDVDEGMVYKIHIDRKTTLTGVYDSETDTTTWTLPYAESNIQVIYGENFIGQAGSAIPNISRPTATTVTASGDVTTDDVIVGRPYKMLYRFSTQYLRESDQPGAAAITEGHLQLLKFRLVYLNSGGFYLRIKLKGRDEKLYYHKGRLGSSSLVLGVPVIDSGTLSAGVLSSSENATIEVINESQFPTAIQSAEWEGLYTSDARRV